MATFLDIYNKKMALEKKRDDKQFEYADQKLKDDLAQIKGIADTLRMGVDIAKVATESEEALSVENQQVEDLDIEVVEEADTWKMGPLEGEDKPFKKVEKYYYEEQGNIVELKKADIKALHTEVKYGDETMGSLLFDYQSQDDTKISGVKSEWSFDTGTVEGLKQQQKAYKAIMSSDKYDQSLLGTDAWKTLEGDYQKMLGESKRIDAYVGGAEYAEQKGLGFDLGTIKDMYDPDRDWQTQLDYATTVKKFGIGEDYEGIFGEDAKAGEYLSGMSQDEMQKKQALHREFDRSSSPQYQPPPRPSVPVESEFVTAEEYEIDDPFNIDDPDLAKTFDLWDAPDETRTLTADPEFKPFDVDEWENLDIEGQAQMIRNKNVPVPRKYRDKFQQDIDDRASTGWQSIFDEDADLVSIIGHDAFSAIRDDSEEMANYITDQFSSDRMRNLKSGIQQGVIGTDVDQSAWGTDMAPTTDADWREYEKKKASNIALKEKVASWGTQDVASMEGEHFTSEGYGIDPTYGKIPSITEQLGIKETDTREPFGKIKSLTDQIPDMTDQENWGGDMWSEYFRVQEENKVKNLEGRWGEYSDDSPQQYKRVTATGVEPYIPAGSTLYDNRGTLDSILEKLSRDGEPAFSASHLTFSESNPPASLSAQFKKDLAVSNIPNLSDTALQHNLSVDDPSWHSYNEGKQMIAYNYYKNIYGDAEAKRILEIYW